MNASSAQLDPTHRRKARKRLWILLGCLIALCMVHLAGVHDLAFLARDRAATRPLDRCITQQAVLDFLDGKTVSRAGAQDVSGTRVETIKLRKERISSLRIRRDDDEYSWKSILVSFRLDHEGRSSRVEGSFEFTTSDSPELHYHGWGEFVGQVVSGR